MRAGARESESGDSGAERGESKETASPMVLHCGILWESR